MSSTAWILFSIVTIVYAAIMAILFWRYRAAVRRLAEKLKQCQEQEDAKKAAETAAMQNEEFTGKHSTRHPESQ